MDLLLIEDDQAYQLAMASHLQRLPGVQQVRVACDGEQGLDQLQEAPGPDLVLLDLVLPGMGGLATCQRITASTAIPVLILTSQDDPQWVRRIWQAGARGYLHKQRAFAQVELALPSILAGASWWDHTATAALQAADSAASAEPRQPQTHLEALTQREREALACLAEGENNRAIAQRLGIGEGTVRSHVHVLLHKLAVSNRTQAALIWHAAGDNSRQLGGQGSDLPGGDCQRE
jgi:two-component system NarL family response regulator